MYGELFSVDDVMGVSYVVVANVGSVDDAVIEQHNNHDMNNFIIMPIYNGLSRNIPFLLK